MQVVGKDVHASENISFRTVAWERVVSMNNQALRQSQAHSSDGNWGQVWQAPHPGPLPRWLVDSTVNT